MGFRARAGRHREAGGERFIAVESYQWMGQLGRRTDMSSEKATTILGWSPRPIQETIIDCARSLIDKGVVKQPA
jgi:nucleoside-diphosphate-sugar epimerase